MAQFESAFPVLFLYEDDFIDQEKNEEIKNRCLEIYKSVPQSTNDWKGGTYTTHDTYDISQDSTFRFLINKITNYVNQFAEMHDSFVGYSCVSGWANIAKKGDYQEYHSHPGSIFSVVYYVNVPEGSGKILFEDPKAPDMFPPKKIIKGSSVFSHNTISYEPKEKRIIIFRSYLRHLVEQGTNVENRISLAFNFV